MIVEPDYDDSELIRRAKGGDRDAVAELIRMHGGLIAHYASRVNIRNMDLADKIQEGHITLLGAVEQFDAGKGVKFSTYLGRAVARNLWKIATRDASAFTVSCSVVRVAAAVERRMGCGMSFDEAFRESKAPTETVTKDAVRAAMKAVGAERDGRTEFMIQDSLSVEPVDRLIAAEEKAERDAVVDRIRCGLEGRDRDVFDMAMVGESGSGPMDIREIADRIGLDPQTVGVIVKSLCRKVSDPGDAVSTVELDNEIRPVPWCPGYGVTREGTAWRRKLTNKDKPRYGEWARINTSRTSTGFIRCSLYARGERFTRYMDRLILEAFVGPQPDGMDACRTIDESADVSRLDRLRWGPASESAVAHDEMRGKPHRDTAKMVSMRESGMSCYEIASRLDCSSKTVWRICDDPRRKAVL